MFKKFKKAYISIEIVVIAAVVLIGGLTGLSAFTKNGQNAQSQSAEAMNNAINMIGEEFDFSVGSGEVPGGGNLPGGGEIPGGEEPLLTTAGLYDENNDMIASWEELTGTYNLNITTSWGSSGAESNSRSLYNILKNNSELSGAKTLVISNQINTIGAYAFNYTEGIDTIIIPEGELKSIPKYAFYGSSFKEIIISESVERIEQYGFHYSKNLKNFTMPDSVTYVGKAAFSSCVSLESIQLSNNLTGELPEDMFNGCKALITIQLPSGITAIGDEAFYECTSLTGIVLHEGIEEIGESAFHYCGKLVSVTLPNTLKTIKARAFGKPSVLSDIYYNGTTEEFKNITKNKEFSTGYGWIDNGNVPSGFAIHCTDGNLTKYQIQNY